MSQLSILGELIAPPPADGTPRWTPPRELPSLHGVQRVALDTEGTGLNPWKDYPVGISMSWRADGIQSIYLPFGHSAENMDPDTVFRYVKDQLAGKDVVFAGAKFDVHMCRRLGIDFEALGVKPHDVAFKDALLDDERIGGHGLDALGHRYVGEGKLDFPGRMQDLPASAVAPYAMGDSRLTLLVDEATDPLIRREGLGRVLDLEDSIIYAVCYLERCGSRIDVPTLERWLAEANEFLSGLVMQIYKDTGMAVQVMSPDSLLALCYHLGVPPPEKRTAPSDRHPRGQISFTDEEIEKLAALHPSFGHALTARRVQSLKNKFLDKFRDGLVGDILRSQFHQMKTDDDFGTVSGRFSSSGGGREDNGYSFNAQQTIKPSAQKKDGTDRWTIRQLFIPAEGQRYFSADAKQIEYRLFGHFSGAKHIIDAYNNDPLVDMHARATALATPFAPELAAKWGDKFRDHVKNVNFARLYGALEEQIADMLGIPVEDARAFGEVLDQVFPEAPVLLNQKRNEARERGFVSTAIGRRARFGSKGNRRGLHSAVNRVIQGTAADLMKLKLRRVYQEHETLGVTALRMTIHDELDGDIDPDPRYHARLGECFEEQELQLKVPISWDMSVGANWLECK